MNSLENLSDKYEDQFSRLETAMIELFKYENLLNNEYLVRKLETDLAKPDHYLLQYVVVQRENSIKNKYVQNEQNDRKQYHLILTAILKKYDNQLWNFDHNQLLIRPYFPSQRKRVQIKSGASNISNIKESLKNVVQNREQLQFEQEIYQADKSLIKLTITCQSEQYADEIFTYLMSNKSKLQIDSVMMQSINYLDEFHKQINLKKCAMISNKKSPQFDNYEDKEEKQDKDNQNSGFSKGKSRQNYGQQEIKYNEDYKNTRGKGRFDRKQGNNGNRQNNQYFQKGESQQQYQMVTKNVNQTTTKLQIQQNLINQNDFPTLSAQQN
ncbi:unnamed protein product [Paramecium pentaurelia]|uniref:Uncharacterized protein n=1 Tax=Paramecium pentaurelia TaxID=43138 RepID=A0A8S1T8K4_9CILI|nr:unnamed protein product [Paramecium pentaurelia]